MIVSWWAPGCFAARAHQDTIMSNNSRQSRLQFLLCRRYSRCSSTAETEAASDSSVCSGSFRRQPFRVFLDAFDNIRDCGFRPGGLAAIVASVGYSPAATRMKKPQEWLEQMNRVVELVYHLLAIYMMLAANGH